jgi:hypothetical protein
METGSSKTPSERSRRSEMEARPQTERKHPDEWAGDLNPERLTGQNIGEGSSGAEQNARNARDVKEVHRELGRDFRDDELRQIPILEAGQRLQQGARYLDLRDPERRELTATGEMSADPDSRLVPKDGVPYSLWNRLRGVDDEERIAERGDREAGPREGGSAGG